MLIIYTQKKLSAGYVRDCNLFTNSTTILLLLLLYTHTHTHTVLFCSPVRMKGEDSFQSILAHIFQLQGTHTKN